MSAISSAVSRSRVGSCRVVSLIVLLPTSFMARVAILAARLDRRSVRGVERRWCGRHGRFGPRCWEEDVVLLVHVEMGVGLEFGECQIAGGVGRTPVSGSRVAGGGAVQFVEEVTDGLVFGGERFDLRDQ